MKIDNWREMDYYNAKLKNVEIGKFKKEVFAIMENYQLNMIDNKISELAKLDEEYLLSNIVQFTDRILKCRKKCIEQINSYIRRNSLIPELLGIPSEKINRQIFLSNFIVLYFLEKNFTKIKDIKEYIVNFKNSSYNYTKPIFIKSRFGMGDRVKKNLHKLHFLALKWFYSEETKHLYSKELLKEMKEYEEEIKNIKWEDCIREPGEFDRARF